MTRLFPVTVLAAWLLAAPVAVRAQNAPAQPPSPASADSHPVELDHVVASVGSNVILESDIRQEMRLSALEPLRVLPGENSPDRALRRIIDRTLILEQMKQQQQAVSTPQAAVEKSLIQLRRQIPDCHCQTTDGWDNFLKAHELTRHMVEERWSQRMAMLHFINLRFQSGIRITPEEISNYYEKILVPALREHQEKPPPLEDVSARIHEILLQQQVSGLFQDWLSSLRDQGHVRIVDPNYTAELTKPQSGGGDEGDQ